MSTAHPVPEHPATISVIVRSMDRPTLSAALESAAQQDLAGVEIRVVTACGPRHSRLPPRAGRHPVYRVDLGHPLRRAAAANAGLDAALGRCVIFLDDDDVFLPDHLPKLRDALQSAPDAVAAYADVDYGRTGPDGWLSLHVFGGEFDPLRLRFENFMPMHAVLVDRSRAGAAACRFDDELDLFEDWDWWLQLVRHGRFVHVAGVSARYVASADSGSGVFADDETSTAARRRLLCKWLARDTLTDRLDLLHCLQQQYRTARQYADELAMTGRTARDLRFILTARDSDIASASRQIDDLHALVNAREREIQDALEQINALREVIAAREREIANGNEFIESLRRTLAARDEEVVNMRAELARRKAP